MDNEIACGCFKNSIKVLTIKKRNSRRITVVALQSQGGQPEHSCSQSMIIVKHLQYLHDNVLNHSQKIISI